MKEITLQGKERQITLSEKKPVDIAEMKVTIVPEDGKWFRVNPTEIDQRFFQNKRMDMRQEATRQIILQAFAKMQKDAKYAREFHVMRAKKKWREKKVRELEEIANNLGDRMADWVEQALTWAQRINNGESWEDICNKPDKAKWYRLVKWKNGEIRKVGGARSAFPNCPNNNPASCVGYADWKPDIEMERAVPLVVIYLPQI